MRGLGAGAAALGRSPGRIPRCLNLPIAVTCAGEKTLALFAELNGQDVSHVSTAFLPFLGFRISNLTTWPGIRRFHGESGFCRLFPAEPSLGMLSARKNPSLL